MTDLEIRQAIAAMECAIERALQNANISTFDQIEDAVFSLRTRFDADPDSVSESDIAYVYLMIKAAKVPSIENIRWLWSNMQYYGFPLNHGFPLDGSVKLDGTALLGL
jgi:hypothetical protein